MSFRQRRGTYGRVSAMTALLTVTSVGAYCCPFRLVRLSRPLCTCDGRLRCGSVPVRAYFWKVSTAATRSRGLSSITAIYCYSVYRHGQHGHPGCLVCHLHKSWRGFCWHYHKLTSAMTVPGQDTPTGRLIPCCTLLTMYCSHGRHWKQYWMKRQPLAESCRHE